MTTKQVGPATISRLASGVYSPMAMPAGMQLDVFTPLKDGPLPCVSVAAAIRGRSFVLDDRNQMDVHVRIPLAA